MTATNSPPVLGLAQAAKAAGVSESTLRRRRGELKEHGATQTDKGWRIPIPALVSLGLMPATTPAEAGRGPERPAESLVEPSTTPDQSSALTARVEALQRQLAEAEQRAAVAEAVLVERERILEERERTIQVQDMALRMLEAPVKAPETAPAPEPVAHAQEPGEAPQQGAGKRRFWRW